MSVNVAPYEGSEPYLFISYCHKDKDFVYPMIDMLNKNGYRVWYDNGIHVGDNWLETIATHLNGSKAVIAIISEAAASSHNCLNEINLTLEQHIQLIPVVHTKFDMSLAVRLILGTTQYIKEYEYDLKNSAEARSFYTNLLASEQCCLCRKNEFTGKQLTITEMKLPEPKIEVYYVDKNGSIVESEKYAAYMITRIIDSNGRIREEKKNVQRSRSRKGILIDLKNGRVFNLSAISQIGRDKSNEVYIDDDNAKVIGRHHARIDLDGKNSAEIIDLDSTNGTYLFGKRMIKGNCEPLYDYTILSLANRHMLYLENESAQTAMDLGVCAVLECLETKEIVGIGQGFILGRDNPWPRDTFGEKDEAYIFLSHNHGHFIVSRDGYYFMANQSTNGTFYNGKEMNKGECTPQLKNGDEINIAGRHTIKYYGIKLQEQ